MNNQYTRLAPLLWPVQRENDGGSGVEAGHATASDLCSVTAMADAANISKTAERLAHWCAMEEEFRYPSINDVRRRVLHYCWFLNNCTQCLPLHELPAAEFPRYRIPSMVITKRKNPSSDIRRYLVPVARNLLRADDLCASPLPIPHDRSYYIAYTYRMNVISCRRARAARASTSAIARCALRIASPGSAHARPTQPAGTTAAAAGAAPAPSLACKSKQLGCRHA
eukprot:6202776-Pleurochrysis_carterae.AAC.2